MAEYTKESESIEAEKIGLTTRTFIFQSTINDPVVGKLFKYKCKTNVRAVIIEELNPKIYKRCKDSHLEVNDAIAAGIIELYCQKIVKLQKSANFSSTHGIQTGETKSYSHAQISIPFRFVLEKSNA